MAGSTHPTETLIALAKALPQVELSDEFAQPPGFLDERRWADRIVRPTILLAMGTVSISLLAPLVAAPGTNGAPTVFVLTVALALGVLVLAASAAWDQALHGIIATVAGAPLLAAAWLALSLNLLVATPAALKPWQAAAPFLLIGAAIPFLNSLPRRRGYLMAFALALVASWVAVGAAALTA